MGDWATISADVLTLVVQHLVYMEDFFSLGAVCKSWKSILSTSKKIPVLPPKFPLLMLPEDQIKEEEKKEEKFSSRRKFYCLSSLQIGEIKMPQAIGRKCLGTFNGWLLTVDVKRNSNANLIRPFFRQTIALPRLFSFNYPPQSAINVNTCVVKVAMSGNPLDVNNPMEKCIVVAIARDHPVLASARIGGQVWTMYPSPPDGIVYYDVAYYKGTFHAVDINGVLFICDVSVHNIAPREITAPVAPPRNWKQMYLIESSGDLLLVYRIHIRRRNQRVSQYLRRSTAGFVVYKLEEVSGVEEYPYKWTEVNNLRGRTLFLGGDVSVSSCSTKHAKPDCIYFSEDDPEKYPGGWDTRVYNMKNNTAEVLYYSRP